MEKNIFLKERKEATLEEYMNYGSDGRGNLREDIPVAV